MTWWEAGPLPDTEDLDTVGLTLRPEASGEFVVAGVARKNGRPVVDGVRVGDKIVRIGTLTTAGATMGAVAGALRGTRGAKRTIVVERDGKLFEIEAKVVRFP